MLRTLLVGCGLIARAKYLPALRLLQREIGVAALCDQDTALATQLAASFRIPFVYPSLPEALEKVRPELVFLCTPPQTHGALSLEAIRAGAHLFLEKPMALTTAECQRILAQAQERDRKVCVAFSQSFSPVVLKARKLIEKGAIGELRGMEVFLSTPSDYMTAKPNHWVHRLPGGALSETGPHLLHLAISFLGRIQQSSVIARKVQPFPWVLADDYRIHLTCERGSCSASLLYTTNQWAARVDLVGSHGRLTLDLESGLLIHHRRGMLTPKEIWASGAWDSLQTLSGLVRRGFSFLAGMDRTGHQRLIQEFIRSLRNGAEPPVPPTEALQVTQVLEDLTKQCAESPESPL